MDFKPERTYTGPDKNAHDHDLQWHLLWISCFLPPHSVHSQYRQSNSYVSKPYFCQNIYAQLSIRHALSISHYDPYPPRRFFYLSDFCKQIYSLPLSFKPIDFCIKPNKFLLFYFCGGPTVLCIAFTIRFMSITVSCSVYTSMSRSWLTGSSTI